MAQRYFVGIDGGGTKTEVIVSDQNGQIIGNGLSGPTNLDSVVEAVSCANLLAAVEYALGTIDKSQSELYVYMGASGVDTDVEIARSTEVFGRALAHLPIKKFIVINDGFIALASGTDNPNSLILIGGTGSNCIGHNEHGQVAKAGGMGFLLADQGSGYYIGRQVLREAVKSFDGRRPKTMIEQLVCEYFKIPSIINLKEKVYNPPLSKDQIAQLSPLCSKAVEANDQVALMIFSHVVDELMLHTSTVIKRLDIQHTTFDCVCVGSVINLPYIKEQCFQRLQQEFPTCNLVFPQNPPVYGAVKLAKTLI